MERLDPLDAMFLDLEDRHTSLAIAAVVVLAGPPPGGAELLAGLAAKLSGFPRHRQRLHRSPLGLAPPAWVDDPRFDLHNHVRRIAAPAPGDDAALADLVAMIMSAPLDRDRPLWECWVVEGLAGGRWALVPKVHHCVTDGVSGSRLLETILADPDDGAAAQAPAGSSAPARTALPARLPLALLDALRSPSRPVKRLATAARGLLALTRALVPGPGSALSGPTGRHRRYAMARVPLRALADIAHAHGATVNDVVLAVLGGAYRDLLLRRGERPAAGMVPTLVPVWVGGHCAPGLGNKVSLLLADLPVHLADPLDRVHAAHAQLTRLKHGGETAAGESIVALARYEPFAAVSRTVRLAARLPQRAVVTVATNVAGPARPLSLFGRRVIELFPYVPIAIRMRTGVAVLSYCDRMFFGVTTDRDSTPEADLLAAGIERAAAALTGTATSSERV